ncbi:MAG: hypothetical protein ACOCYB_04860 [Alkalispirochaeta sp.]
MSVRHLHLLRGYGRLLRVLLQIALWVAALGVLSTIITLPLWFAASRVPTAYTVVSSSIVVIGVGWLLIGGRRPTGRALLWTGTIALLLAGIMMGWYSAVIIALVLASGIIAYRLS